MNDKFEEAKRLLSLALVDLDHAPSCPWAEFERHNRMLPRSHPAWKSAPACCCLVTDIAKFLLDN